jgi:hypothetical protein
MLWFFFVIGVYALSSSTLSRWHGCSSPSAGQSNAEYFVWLHKRDRWFREEHLSAAALGGLVPLAVYWLFNGGNILPVLASYVAFAATWAVVREMKHKFFPDGMMWSKGDMRRVLICLCAGTIACLATTLFVAGGVPVALCGAAWFSSCAIWAALFPM